jgi:hypothetical protein
MRVLQGLNGVFRIESSHQKCQFTVGCHLDWCRIDSLNVLKTTSTVSMNFHRKFDVFHALLSFETLATPHSKQRAFSRDVINPQFGHILCDPNPATCGFNLRIHCSSRVMNSTISRPRKMLVALIKRPFLASPAPNGMADHSLAEKPKVGSSDGLA